MRKQLGAIRGVKVGDKFRYRAQLNIVGLHRHFTNGIDYIKSRDGKILVTSIVDSGRYANNMQCSDVLIYSGEGGNSPFNKLKPTDQTLERGNLALKNSTEAQTPVRVIRTFKLSKSSCYVYYGLYIVEHLSKERGQFGKMVYKFRLRRKAGQPEITFKL
ncbi:putative histone-lysine N-methyltransferase [Rosa chinensis]|uniref:Putative histone-lysine N-methyltransferase n=1 Tax=Rosa chinensis TaxID=74649 RepID=A0A2P6SA24_ROSCH|nr:putative histone-lysine N-methyltransferase [Rosa chinensis]